MDVAVAPYSAEGFYFSPLKVYEAMAAGLPVVASAVGQVSRVIDDGVTGLLCQPDDAASMARQLVKLEADPTLRRRIGGAARSEILAHHTWPLRVDEIFDLAGVASKG